jgi:N-ethylmaleimide reductase
VELHAANGFLIEQDATPATGKLAPVLKQAFGGALILTGDFTRESGAAAILEARADAIAYGRLYIANPDLVERFAPQTRLSTFPTRPHSTAA